MIYAYAVIAAALVPVLDRYYPILRQSYSLWLVPVIFIGAFLCLIILHLAVFGIALLTVKPGVAPKKRGFYRFTARLTLPLVAKIVRIKLKISGADLIPENERFVIITNHTSIFDPVILMAAFPECDFAFMAKSEVIKEIPIVARFISSQGGTFVDRTDKLSGAKALIDMIKLLKANEASVGIFPEGTRSKTGELLPFKPGAVRAASKAGVPLVVCTVKNAALVAKNLPFRSTKVYIDILKTFSADEVAAAADEELQNTAYEIMRENLAKRPTGE